MKVLVVFGTRPEAIKMAPVVRALQTHATVTTRVCVTAQHRDLLDDVLSTFGIVPDHDLSVMQAGQDLYDVTSKVLLGARDVTRRERPDIVLVHGDTTTTFAASLAAFYEKVPVGHVEAGLRSGDLTSPWPEEANRRLTGVLASVHFAPTARHRRNLLAEGVSGDDILVTGNTVVDALLESALVLDAPGGGSAIRQSFPWYDVGRKMVLITCHRRENFGAPLARICRAVRRVAASRNDVTFVFPVHPNPAVREPVHEILSGQENVRLVAPQSYLPFIWLMREAAFILTDSGGVQEEAPTFGKPLLILRENTERPEVVEAGLGRLVGSDEALIVAEITSMLDHPVDTTGTANPYGDGKASDRIAQAIVERFP